MGTTFFFFSLLLVSTVLPVSDSKADNVRVCVSANPSLKSSHTVKSCEQLARSKKTQATCVFATDRLECLQLVSDRKADLTVLEAEDLLFATSACPSPCNVLVVSEVRVLKKNPYEYRAVVVVRKDADVRPDLKGARLCHPGWTHQDARSGLFSQYLEERVAPQSCQTGLSLLEDRLRTSAEHFGPSCKAGAWSADKEEDARLKAAYPSLCAGCDDPVSCSTLDKYWGDGGAATCLKDGVGNALWTTYADVRLYFKTSLSRDEPSNYQYLCPNGTTQTFDAEEPCTWLARPWQTVVANSKVAMEVQKAMDLVSDESLADWEESVLSVFEAHKEYIVNLEVAKPPEDYLEDIPGYMGGNEMTLPNCNPSHQVTWCVTSAAAHRKCSWIAQAAKALAVAPALSCEQRTSVKECLQAVDKMEADVTVVPPDHQPQAQLHHNLEPFFYEDFKSVDGGYNLVALTKRNSAIKTLSELRGRRACFTLHQGLAWRAALVTLRDANLITHSCTATSVLHDFFSQVCVSSGTNATSDTPLCCGRSNDADPDAAAFRCLAEDGCDVAFVSNATIYENTDGNNSAGWASGLRSSDFRRICTGDKYHTKGDKYHNQGDKNDCSWASSAPSAIMASDQLPPVRRQEVRHVFSELSRLFMRRNKGKSLILAVFGPFQDEHNVLFQDSSTDLTAAERYTDHKSASHTVQEILNATRYCNASPSTSVPVLTLLIPAALVSTYPYWR